MNHAQTTTLLITTALFLIPSSVGAFGITPASIVNNRLLPGSELETTILLSRQQEDTPLTIDLKTDTPNMKNWVSFEPATVVFPSGITALPLKVRVHVPKNATSGDYSGAVLLREEKNETIERSGNISVVGASLKLDLAVTTTKISDFSLLSLDEYRVDPAKKIWFFTLPGKIHLPLLIQNTGNSSVAIDNIQIDIYSTKNKKKIIETLSVIPSEKIPPFTTKKITTTLRHYLPPGEYMTNIRVFEGYKLTDDGERQQLLTIAEPSIQKNLFTSLFSPFYKQ